MASDDDQDKSSTVPAASTQDTESRSSGNPTQSEQSTISQDGANRAMRWNQTSKALGAVRTKLGGRSVGLRTSFARPSQSSTNSKSGLVNNGNKQGDSAPTKALGEDSTASPGPGSEGTPTSKAGSTTLEVDENGDQQDTDLGSARQPSKEKVNERIESPEPAPGQGSKAQQHIKAQKGTSQSPPNGMPAHTNNDDVTSSSDQLTSDYEDDKGVILNVINDNSDLQSGEISEEVDDEVENDQSVAMEEDTEDNESNGSDDPAASESSSSSSSSEEEGEVSETESSSSSSDDSTSQQYDGANDSDASEVDPMKTYSDSTAIGKPRPSTSTTAAVTTTTTTTPRQLTLADLSTHDLKLQLRYFYLTKDPQTIPSSAPARCLVCTSTTHTRPTCPHTTCRTCSSTAHFTHACPQTTYCARCRKQGHATSSCPSPLAAHPAADGPIPCALCGRHGSHAEARCETHWRTSGYPWLRDVANPAADPRVHLSCYECGRPGHLGNDCPSRRPGKILGSSSWSARAWALPPPNAGFDGGGVGARKGAGAAKGPGSGPRPGARIGRSGGKGARVMPNTAAGNALGDGDSSGEDRMSQIKGRAKHGPGAYNGGGQGRQQQQGMGIRIAGLANASAGPRNGRGGGYGNGRDEYSQRGPPQNFGRGQYDYGRDGYERGYNNGGYERRRSRSPARGPDRGGGDRYISMPSSARDAWSRGRT